MVLMQRSNDKVSLQKAPQKILKLQFPLDPENGVRIESKAGRSHRKSTHNEEMRAQTSTDRRHNLRHPDDSCDTEKERILRSESISA